MGENEARSLADDSLQVVLNEHIDLIYDCQKKRVVIRIDGKEFISCAALVTSIENLARKNKDISSIDELVEIYDDNSWITSEDALRSHITPMEELFAHASNIQAWLEHDYNPCILHSNIAFPLLRELVRVGDDKARRVMEATINERMENGNSTTRKALVLYFRDELTSHQWEQLWNDPDPTVVEIAVECGPITPELISKVLEKGAPGVRRALGYSHRREEISSYPPGSISPSNITWLIEHHPWFIANYHHLNPDQLRVLSKGHIHTRQALAKWIRGPSDVVESLLKDPDPITRDLIKKNIS